MYHRLCTAYHPRALDALSLSCAHYNRVRLLHLPHRRPFRGALSRPLLLLGGLCAVRRIRTVWHAPRLFGYLDRHPPLTLSIPPASRACASSHPLSRPSSSPVCLALSILLASGHSHAPCRLGTACECSVRSTPSPPLFKPPSRSTPLLTPFSAARLLAHQERRHWYVSFAIVLSSPLLPLNGASSPGRIDHAPSSVSATISNAAAQAHLPTTHQRAKCTLSSHTTIEIDSLFVMLTYYLAFNCVFGSSKCYCFSICFEC